VILTEPVAVTLLITKELEDLRIPYFIGGSLASALFGIIRATRGVDLVADIQSQHVGPLSERLKTSFYVQAEDIHDAIRHRSSFNIIHLETFFKADVFVLKGRVYDRAQFQRRFRHVISTDPERTAYFCSVEDTILSKLEWYRLGNEISERQWYDVLGVMKVQREVLDHAYMQQWAAELGLTDLLARALEDAGV
jgi:hypothetical protein